MERTCPTCGGSMEGKRRKTKHCSRRCSPTPGAETRAHRRLPDRTCPTCDTSFHPENAKQRFCSRSCIPREVLSTARPGPKPHRRCQRHDQSDRVVTSDGKTECRGCRDERREARKARERAATVERREAKAKLDAEWEEVFREAGLLT